MGKSSLRYALGGAVLLLLIAGTYCWKDCSDSTPTKPRATVNDHAERVAKAEAEALKRQQAEEREIRDCKSMGMGEIISTSTKCRGRTVETRGFVVSVAEPPKRGWEDVRWLSLVEEPGSQGPVIVCNLTRSGAAPKIGAAVRVRGVLEGRVLTQCSILAD